jgi:hypothetical protein
VRHLTIVTSYGKSISSDAAFARLTGEWPRTFARLQVPAGEFLSRCGAGHPRRAGRLGTMS